MYTVYCYWRLTGWCEVRKTEEEGQVCLTGHGPERQLILCVFVQSYVEWLHGESLALGGCRELQTVQSVHREPER